MLPIEKIFQSTTDHLEHARCDRLIGIDDYVYLTTQLRMDYLRKRLWGPGLIYSALFFLPGPITGLFVSLYLMSSIDNGFLKLGAYEIFSLLPGPMLTAVTHKLWGSQINRLVPTTLSSATEIRERISQNSEWAHPQNLGRLPPHSLFSLPVPH